MITFYLARADNGVIGLDHIIPWHIPGEQRRFKAMTMGKPMVMGRKTFESFKAPLPGRRHIVLTRNPDWSAPGAEGAHPREEAIALAGAVPEILGEVPGQPAVPADHAILSPRHHERDDAQTATSALMCGCGS